MSPRPDVSNERKNQIINAAEQVFTEKGFYQARMDDIAGKTGLSKGTLYLYFKSKDDLIVAILDRIFNIEFKRMEELDLAKISAIDAIWQYTDMATRGFLDMMRIMPIAYEFLALAFRNKYVQVALKLYMKRYMEVVIPIVQHGIQTGEFRPVDPQETAIAMGAIFEGTVLLWVYDKTLVEPGRHIHTGIELLLEGMLAR